MLCYAMLCYAASIHYQVLEAITRACFQHIKYLNGQLVRGQINFPDVSAKDGESRNDTAGNTQTPSLIINVPSINQSINQSTITTPITTPLQPSNTPSRVTQ